jgi:Zn-dependent protease with chaperone function/MFS family permease
MAFVPFFFAKKIIKAVMKAEPTTREQDPEFFAIMEELRDKINAERRAKGKKEIPMPEMVLDPMMAPNAYATGRSPFHAMVGVTRGIKAMTLEPETVREGVTRLLAGVEPDSKAFRVFRLAIQGSLKGVPAEGTPAEVAAVVLKASREELHHLGYRMLRGVLGHEFSHVMDRHMLSGSIAGAIASGVAFASYGVMWAVGHAQVKAKEALDRVLGRETPAPEKKGEGARPHAFEPLTTGVAMKSLPALLKLLAALWAPIVLQVTQMASSRNNEGMADEDGALLSEDPESLALGLGLLTTWRPPQGFVIPGATLPRAAALQHIMTVNPLDQLEQAGLRPALGASGAPTKADDFLFEMFITHPNTGTRIEKLHDMSRAMKGMKLEKPRPPSDSGGGGGGPLAFAPNENSASGRIGGGLLRGAWEALKRPFRVLPDEGRNRQFWTYTAGQALLMVGVNFHYTSLPRLVAPEKSQSDLLGYNRAINWGAQAASSLATGPLVDRSSSQSVIVWTYLGRAVLMAAVPVLFFAGHFGFAAFTALVAIAGFLQMTGMTAGSVAFNRILGEDQSHYNRANAVYNIVLNVVGVLAPLAAGAFIAYADARWGALSGNALSYGVYGALLAAVAAGYARWLKPPRDEMMAARRALHAKLKAEGAGPVRYAGVTAGRADGAPALIVEVDGDPALAVLPREFEGYAVIPAAKRRVLAELMQGFRVVLKDRFLRVYLLSLTLSVAASDALIFAAIPRFIADVLNAGAGSFGLFLAASALGLGLGSAAMAVGGRRRPGDEVPDARGLDRLQRQGRWSSWLHGLSWLAYAAIFLSGSVTSAAGLMLLSAALTAPGMVAWASLTTRVVAGRYPQDQGKVYSAMYFYQLGFSIAGVLLFGWLMSFMPTMTVLWLAGGVMVLCALIDFVVPRFVFPLDRSR